MSCLHLSCKRILQTWSTKFYLFVQEVPYLATAAAVRKLLASSKGITSSLHMAGYDADHITPLLRTSLTEC